jgi:asparagine synthase (glutamine-hydrolysing)
VCGIAGLFDPRREIDPDRLGRDAAAMAAALTHRGPDDSGLWVDPDGRVAFGHRRLAVVDLSPLGRQPMVSADGRWVLSYNGEIYNFKDLRHRLAREGAVFRGSSDTEVLVAAVEHWGVDQALEASEGMFALSLWDRHRRQLHLVRDRFGEKPLYYGWVGTTLAFSSELKSLHHLADFAPELDRDAVALYLRYSCVPSPHTVYQGVRKVRPGQILTFGDQARPGVPPEDRLFWSAGAAVESARRRPLVGTENALIDQAEDVLSRSVADRMVADVPIGAFLSGGVDSSLVVSLMQQHSDRPVQTFTAGFADQAFDESDEAGSVAAHLGTDHTLLRVADSDAADVIPRIPDIWDEPFADISQIPVLLVSELARTQVTVSLSGDGGDELFAGYNRHAWLERLWRHAATLPAPVRRAAGSVLERIPPGAVDGVAGITGSLPVRWQVRNPATKVAKVAKVLAAKDPADAYLGLVSHWDSAESMVLGARPQGSLGSDPWPELSGMTEQMLWLDLVGYLPDDILTKVDRAAMAVSLETRVPFLDRSVFDLAWRMPMSMKLHDGVTKWILRQVLYRHVPAALVDRPKMGFGVPIGSWLRGPLRPWAEELLDEKRLARQGLLDVEAVRRAWGQHLAGRRDRAYELWDVLVLEAWLDRWMPALTG